MVLCSLPTFHFRSHQGVCDTPLRFSCDAETTIFSHHDLRNCFTIKDELANGKPSSAGHQGYFRDGESGFENRAKYIFHLRKEDCFLCKTAIATAMEVDHLAQTASAFCRNEIVPQTKWRRQLPKRYCPLRKPSSHLPKRNCPSDTEASAIAMGLCTPWQAFHRVCEQTFAGATRCIFRWRLLVCDGDYSYLQNEDVLCHQRLGTSFLCKSKIVS